ncbi:MAG: NUDIX hydrolase [Gammaproteobacteria bacterium]|nr:MAG: NUDIX hydrolase [Gammaproteobacteria bacterium]
MPAPVTPLLAVDIVIRPADRPERIVLIERRNPPPGWALPGGFVDRGECVEQAAMREAREETSLEVRLLALLGCYSNPSRDPRGHVASLVYVADGFGTPRAADDARRLALADAADPGLPLAFDHALILADYRRWLQTGEPAPLRCPEPPPGEAR